MKDFQGTGLLCRGGEVIEGDGEAMFHVTARFRQPLAEIAITIGLDPGIMLRPAIEPGLVNLRRKQFRQGGTGRFLPGRPSGKVQVRVYRKPHTRQHVALVEDLVPATQGLTTVLDNLEGPVLDRVNGPVLDTINSGFDGTGPYEGGGGDNPFYTELAYMVTNLDSASALTDENGAELPVGRVLMAVTSRIDGDPSITSINCPSRLAITGLALAMYSNSLVGEPKNSEPSGFGTVGVTSTSEQASRIGTRSGLTRPVSTTLFLCLVPSRHFSTACR